MADRVPMPLPEGLEWMAPGPELVSVLASVGPAMLSGEDTVTYLQAEYRQSAYQQAQVLRAMVEVGLARGPESVDRLNCPPEFAPDEVRAALVLTRTSATMQMSLAWDLYDRLPEVLARMERGILDLPRARVLSEWTVDLRPDAGRAVIAAILPRAHTLTTGALAAEVKSLAIAVDPDFARRRYESALTSRKVLARRNPDGTANLGGYDLPVDQVAAASTYVQAMALAAKRGGHPGKIDHIRADLYLLLLCPDSRGLSDAELIAELIHRARTAAAAAAAGAGDETAAHEPAGDVTAAHERPAGGRPEPETAGAEQTKPGRAGAESAGPEQPEPEETEPPEPESAGAESAGPAQPEPEETEPAGDEPPGDEPPEPAGDEPPASARPKPESAADESPEPEQTGPEQTEPEQTEPAPATAEQAADEPVAGEQPKPEQAGPAPTPPAAASGKGTEIRVRLSTLLGRDRYPAQMPGWIGPVHAELALQQVMANTGGPWRYVICDTAGMLTHTGPLRTRPTDTPRAGAGTVEIQIDSALLAELAADPTQAGSWAPLVRELARHAAKPPDDHQADRNKRLPGTGLRRFVYVRDRECVFPGCRVPAHHTDIDHSDDHARGGKTAEDNLAPACRHDHRVKHEAGWKLEQPKPGHLRWTTRLGHTYDIEPKPIIPPLPDPIPPDPKGRTYDLSRPDGDHILQPEPDEDPQAPRPPPPPETTVDDDEPPF